MCTNFKVKTAQDGSVVVGRSMEFPLGIPTALGVLPHDFAGSAAAPEGKRGKSWTADHGVIGMSAFGHPHWLTDGMNDAGLSAHFLYMPGGFCTYADFVGDGNDLSEMDVIAYLLGTCASITEVKGAMAGLHIWGSDPGMGFAPPCHILVHDTSASLAIEMHSDGVHLVDNPTSVGTNAPYLDWHLTNLSNYVGLSATLPDPVKVGQLTVTALGQGQGLVLASEHPRDPQVREGQLDVAPGGVLGQDSPDPDFKFLCLRSREGIITCVVSGNFAGPRGVCPLNS